MSKRVLFHLLGKGLSRWNPSHPCGQESEWMEDSREENYRPMCCQSEAGGHCFDRRRTGLLWDGPGMLVVINVELSPEFSSFVWLSFHLWFLLTVWTAEWIHRKERDVCRRGVHEFGKCASWWTALSLPGCWIGGQYCPYHLPGSIRKLRFAYLLSADLGIKQGF